MNNLRQTNISLCRMTNQTLPLEHLRNSRTKTDHYPILKFSIIHDRVKILYSSSYSGWKCSCHADHSINLRLEPRIGYISSNRDGDEDEDQDEDDNLPFLRNLFRVFFCYNYLHIVSTGNLVEPWTWEEADVHITYESQSASQSYQTSDEKGVVKGVRFAKQPKKAMTTALATKPNMQPIQDLCTAIRTLQKPQRDVCLALPATGYPE